MSKLLIALTTAIGLAASIAAPAGNDAMASVATGLDRPEAAGGHHVGHFSIGHHGGHIDFGHHQHFFSHHGY